MRVKWTVNRYSQAKLCFPEGKLSWQKSQIRDFVQWSEDYLFKTDSSVAYPLVKEGVDEKGDSYAFMIGTEYIKYIIADRWKVCGVMFTKEEVKEMLDKHRIAMMYVCTSVDPDPMDIA